MGRRGAVRWGAATRAVENGRWRRTSRASRCCCVRCSFVCFSGVGTQQLELADGMQAAATRRADCTPSGRRSSCCVPTLEKQTSCGTSLTPLLPILQSMLLHAAAPPVPPPRGAALTFWKSESRPGMEVAGVGRGLTAALYPASSRRSSGARASLVTGSRPVSCSTQQRQGQAGRQVRTVGAGAHA